MCKFFIGRASVNNHFKTFQSHFQSHFQLPVSLLHPFPHSFPCPAFPLIHEAYFHTGLSSCLLWFKCRLHGNGNTRKDRSADTVIRAIIDSSHPVNVRGEVYSSTIRTEVLTVWLTTALWQLHRHVSWSLDPVMMWASTLTTAISLPRKEMSLQSKVKLPRRRKVCWPKSRPTAGFLWSHLSPWCYAVRSSLLPKKSLWRLPSRN